MALPYLQSYNDPKKEKAYRRYMAGDAQRKIAAALKIPPRTVAHWSKTDGWEDERRARKAAGESESVAAVAATPAASRDESLQSAATQPPKPDPINDGASPIVEGRMAGMERMLARQQRIVGKLLAAYEVDVEKTMADAEKTGKPITRSQIHQLTTLGNNLLTMERKAWCVPDKIETKDLTPQPEDKVRKLTDEQLERELAEAERAASAAAAREVATGSVN